MSTSTRSQSHKPYESALSTASKALFTHDQLAKGETVDDGVSPYLSMRRNNYSDEEWEKTLQSLKDSSTLYIGNLAFQTTEEELYELFGYAGDVEQFIMGLNGLNYTPCGFAFVKYRDHEHAIYCARYLNNSCVDERLIRCDLDPGFEEGRQYGRSRQTGGQVRDDHRKQFDAGRNITPNKRVRN